MRHFWLLFALAAFSNLSTVRAADPEDAQYNVVVTLYNAGQWQAAVKKIEEREKLSLSDTARARYLSAKGMAYEKGGKTTEARTAYEQLISQYPTAPQLRSAQVALVHLQYDAHDYDAVIKTFSTLDKASVPDAEKRNLALIDAEALYTKDDAKAALAAYDAAIKLGVDKTSVASRLFSLYSRLQMHKELVDLSANGITGLDPDLVSLARAESLSTLGRNAEAETQAAKVAASSPLYPRASFARGLALIKLNKLKDAIDPLTVAVEKLKNPPPPPGTYVTLADCLLENNQPQEAAGYLAKAEKIASSLPDAERDSLLKQITLVKLRQSLGGGNRKDLIAAVTKSRDSLPKDQLSRLLYMRLYALSEENDDEMILQTMKDDYPIFQTNSEDGAATLIYFSSLRKRKRTDEASHLLEDFIRRKPAAPETVRARLELANQALDQQAFDKAVPLLDAIRTSPGAETTLGKDTFQKVLFNRAVAAGKLNQPADAIPLLNQVIQSAPTNSLLPQSYVLLGQMYAVKSDFKNAADTWTKALAAGATPEADVRDRLARALVALKDFPHAADQWDAEAKLLGSTEKLSRENAESFARARFAAGQFAPAAALYEELFQRFHDAPAYAYDCAVAFERIKNWPDAVKWYATARKAKDKLPPEYAAAIEANLANAQLQSGSNDMGANYFVDSLVPATEDKPFSAALASLRKMAAAGKLNSGARGKIETAMAGYSPALPRHYEIGAVLLQAYSANPKNTDLRSLATKLSADFAANEKQLDPKSSGATLAPAVIYFYKGESDRLAGSPADALASYETILSAYPYNEWPDAAACGAAECYLALGDKPTALVKFNEVLKSSASSPASARWSDMARKRIAELNQGN